jgi:hypothetical protein
MSSFDGRLRLPGQAKLPLAVEIDVSGERIRLTAGEETVADWPLDGLEVEARPDGFHFKVDDEQVILSVTDATKFAKELKLPSKPPRPVTQRVNRKPSASPRTVSTGAVDPEDASGKHAASTVDVDDPFAALRGRVAEVAASLTSDSTSPSEAFASWLRTLGELNEEHGRGSLPCDVHFELSTAMLDLFRDEEPDSQA